MKWQISMRLTQISSISMEPFRVLAVQHGIHECDPDFKSALGDFKHKLDCSWIWMRNLHPNTKCDHTLKHSMLIFLFFIDVYESC